MEYIRWICPSSLRPRFFALVPELLHKDTGLECNYTTWLSRGWCRAELWCRLLSNREDTSVIVIFSEWEALYIFPLDWQRNLISNGKFTVESDRAEVVKLGEMALQSKIQHLREEGPLAYYRFYLACRPRLLQQKRPDQDLSGFLQYFEFPSLEAAIREDIGMTGMTCAVLQGDTAILHALVEHRGNANATVTGLGDLGYYDTQTLLMVAAKSSQDAKVLSTLMILRADPNLPSRSGLTAAWLAADPSHVHVLLEYRADLFNAEIPPLIGAGGRSSSATVLALLENRCEPECHTSDGFGALHAVPMFGRANQDAPESVRLLLAFRGDINFQAEPKGRMYLECLGARVHVEMWGVGSSNYQRKMANLPGATPLSVAAIMGDKPVVQTLLENHADLEMPNYQGCTPEELARVAGHYHLLPLLCTFAV